MTQDVESRIGRNEDLFRQVNEAIARGVWHGEEDRRTSFRCECAQLECNLPVRLSLHEYERIRAHPRHFAVRPGHVMPADETVIETHDGYVVIEKIGRAGAVAQSLDPRR